MKFRISESLIVIFFFLNAVAKISIRMHNDDVHHKQYDYWKSHKEDVINRSEKR